MASSKTDNLIHTFNPNIITLCSNNYESYQKEIENFNTGESNYTFNTFLKDESLNSLEDGEGVTYLVLDEVSDSESRLVAYYTLRSGAILYKDRSFDESAKQYDECECAIPAVELVMLAVSKEYQDKFYCVGNEKKLIASMIMSYIIDDVKNIRTSIIGLNGIFLHSVKDAEKFYAKNEFEKIRRDMHYYYNVSADQTTTLMYKSFKEIPYNYED